MLSNEAEYPRWSRAQAMMGNVRSYLKIKGLQFALTSGIRSNPPSELTCNWAPGVPRRTYFF